MLHFFWICIGGALGTGSRYLVGMWAAKTLGTGFPYGTLLVNVVGSLLISIAMYLSVDTAAIPLPVRLFLTTGLLGGFTTYSSFNYETIKLFQSGAWGLAATNILITVLVCAASGLLGLFVGARIAGAIS
ncbi:MAG: fluoride efflux transporter CrcB [Polyangiaceae bacterium]|nr:fluoride efflux transporter CrcB [Polyangiaceae bacterium]